MNTDRGGCMKKWHMEEIVIAVGRGDDKLELPAKSWKIKWAPVAAKPQEKESTMKRYARSRAGRFFNLLG